MGLFNKEPKYDNVPQPRPAAPQQPAYPQQPVQPQGAAPQQGPVQQPVYVQRSPAEAMVDKAERAVNNFRVNLLLVGIFSLANCLLAKVSDMYMMFSLFFPYELVVRWDAVWDVPTPLLAVLALLMIASLFLCWALSKKNPKIVWIAMAVYVGDTFYMLARTMSLGGSIVMSLVFHLLVLFCIGQILVAARQLDRAKAALAQEQSSPVHNGSAPCNHPPVEM